MLQLKRMRSMLLEAPFKEEDEVMFINVHDSKIFQEATVLSNCIGAKTLAVKLKHGGIETLSYDEAARLLLTYDKFNDYRKANSASASPDGSLTLEQIREMIPKKYNLSHGDEICFAPSSSRRFRSDTIRMTNPLTGEQERFLFGVYYGNCRGTKIGVSTYSHSWSKIIQWKIAPMMGFLVSLMPDVPKEAREILKETKKQLGL